LWEGSSSEGFLTTWEQFKKFMDIAHPRKGSTMELMLEA